MHEQCSSVNTLGIDVRRLLIGGIEMLHVTSGLVIGNGATRKYSGLLIDDLCNYKWVYISHIGFWKSGWGRGGGGDSCTFFFFFCPRARNCIFIYPSIGVGVHELLQVISDKIFWQAKKKKKRGGGEVLPEFGRNLPECCSNIAQIFAGIRYIGNILGDTLPPCPPCHTPRDFILFRLPPKPKHKTSSS